VLPFSHFRILRVPLLRNADTAQGFVSQTVILPPGFEKCQQTKWLAGQQNVETVLKNHPRHCTVVQLCCGSQVMFGTISWHFPAR